MIKEIKIEQVNWITIAEACKHWDKSRTPLVNAYWDSKLVMRKSAGTWLVLVDSMIAVFGAPIIPLEAEPEVK